MTRNKNSKNVKDKYNLKIKNNNLIIFESQYKTLAEMSKVTGQGYVTLHRLIKNKLPYNKIHKLSDIYEITLITDNEP